MNYNIMVVGLEGAAGLAVEILARSGFDSFTLIDDDKIEYSDFNKNLLASCATLGEKRTEVIKKHVLEINPRARVEIAYDLHGRCDYIIECATDINDKVNIALYAESVGVPSISCIDLENKSDHTKIKVANLADTIVCPVARILRKRLGERERSYMKVVYSLERSNKDLCAGTSPIFLNVTAGLCLATEVEKDLASIARKQIGILKTV